MKKVFITGGTGFIGQNLKEQLGSKYAICAPSHAELELLDEDAVSDFLRKNQFDVVIHAATWDATRNSKKDLSRVLPNNLRMFFNLARCHKYLGKMIYLGSGEEYDREHWIPKMKEEYFDTYVPRDDSGFSKYIMSKYTEGADKILGLRLFGTFGKYEDWEIRFISNACCKAMWDLPITIKQNVFFDYLYIDDLVRITEWFMGNEACEKVYNVCTGSTIDLLTLARKIITISKKKLDIVITKDELGKEYSGDNSKMLKEMGGYTFDDIDKSISKLYHWYLTNKDSIDRGRLLIDK